MEKFQDAQLCTSVIWLKAPVVTGAAASKQRRQFMRAEGARLQYTAVLFTVKQFVFADSFGAEQRAVTEGLSLAVGRSGLGKGQKTDGRVSN